MTLFISMIAAGLLLVLITTATMTGDYSPTRARIVLATFVWASH